MENAELKYKELKKKYAILMKVSAPPESLATPFDPRRVPQNQRRITGMHKRETHLITTRKRDNGEIRRRLMIIINKFLIYDA